MPRLLMIDGKPVWMATHKGREIECESREAAYQWDDHIWRRGRVTHG